MGDVGRRWLPAGSRKSTPFAAQVAAETAAGKVAVECGVKTSKCRSKALAPAAKAPLRTERVGIKVTSISDVTPVPHNGCRPPKRRRM